MRIVFCLSNLAVAGLFVLSGLGALLSPPERPMQTLVGIVACLIFGCYGLCELISIVRPSVERVLGNLNLVAAAIVIVGIVGNSLEAITPPPIAWGFLFVFRPIGSTIALYLISCGWIRLRIVVNK